MVANEAESHDLVQSLAGAIGAEFVLTDPADGDIGSIFGWGFPAYTGGTLSFIDTVGIGTFVAECDRMTRHYGERFAPSDWLRARAEREETFHGAAGAASRAA